MPLIPLTLIAALGITAAAWWLIAAAVQFAADSEEGDGNPLEDRRKQGADDDCIGGAGLHWVEGPYDLPAETPPPRPGACRGGSPTTAAAAFVQPPHAPEIRRG